MTARGEAGRGPAVPVLRVIARLNIGGPAIQAITLTQRLAARGYQTTLVRGVEGPDEGNMDHLAIELGVHPVRVPTLRRNPGWQDLRALAALVRLLRRERPRIVHTHAAKAGAVGRVAAVLAFPRARARPVLIHTYHGHSLRGYFSRRTASAYRTIERRLARVSDRLIAVSDEVRDELVALGVAPAAKFVVVPLGFDLAPFRAPGPERAAARASVRAELGIPGDATVVTLVARLVPIKRVDRFLRVAARLAASPEVRFLIVGDGELRAELQQLAAAEAVAERIVWTGFRRDMPELLFASDVVVQTSDNEGTPVSLIEAQAAGIPAVSTEVGGVASVVLEGRTGFIVPVEDEAALAERVARLLADPELRQRFGAQAAEHAAGFSLEALIDRLDRLYRAALGQRWAPPPVAGLPSAARREDPAAATRRTDL